MGIGKTQSTSHTRSTHELTAPRFAGLVRSAGTYLPHEYTCRGQLALRWDLHARLGRTSICAIDTALWPIASLVLVAALIGHCRRGRSSVTELRIVYRLSHVARLCEHSAASHWVEHSPRSVSWRN
jgi:hypothetical protein